MSGLWEAERAVLTREVDRLTRKLAHKEALRGKLAAVLLAKCDELADCEAHLIGARRDFEAASRVMLERHEAELAERTRERDDARRAHIRSLFGSGDHVMARGAPFGDPVRCTTHEQVAAVFGWPHLYPEETPP